VVQPAAVSVSKTRVQFGAEGAACQTESDWVAAEEPLEIRVEGKSVAVVMRTPGHDEELVAGFLRTEGVISTLEDIFEISACPSTDEAGQGNVYEALLRRPDPEILQRLTRHVFSASSCGICGKATIESVFCAFPPVGGDFRVPARLLLEFPARLRDAQETFEQTGGLHASALFNAAGELVILREDVGRHNALDKVIGHALLAGKLPLSESVLLMSGRVSFEIMQKALAAGISVIAAISAPSSLAVQFAQDSGQTLVGFLRERGFNVYTHPERIVD